MHLTSENVLLPVLRIHWVNCHNYGNTVTTDSEDAGGLIGHSVGDVISSSDNSSVVRGQQNVGGLVGYNSESSLSNCKNEGNVYGNYFCGAIIGYYNGNYFTDHYHTKKECQVAFFIFP